MAASHSEVWQEGVVVATRPVAQDIVRIEIEVSRPAQVDPGAHVDVRIPVGGVPVRRSYSIVDASPDGARLSLSVFRAETSRGGAAAMHALRPGDRIELTQPRNDFPLRWGAARYVLVAGGVGVTAMLGMAERLRRAGADYRLVYAGRTRERMAYLDELVATHGDRIDVRVSTEGAPLDVDALLDGIRPGDELYVCGPIRLMDAVRRGWTARDYPPTDVRMETFGNSGWFAPQPFTVRVPAVGAEVRVGPEQSMLEALEEAGVDMMYDCRKGECGLCEVRVLSLSGDIDHRDVFYSERQKDARSKMCCCVSRVVGGAGRVVEIVTT